jgi:hypothetical protein
MCQARNEHESMWQTDLLVRAVAVLATSFHVGFLLGSFFDPEGGGDVSSETSIELQWTTWHYIPEDRTLQGS